MVSGLTLEDIAKKTCAYVSGEENATMEDMRTLFRGGDLRCTKADIMVARTYDQNLSATRRVRTAEKTQFDSSSIARTSSSPNLHASAQSISRSVSDKRNINLRLPSFRLQRIASEAPEPQHVNRPHEDRFIPLQKHNSLPIQQTRVESLPLLTPPLDDMDSASTTWNSQSERSGVTTASAGQDEPSAPVQNALETSPIADVLSIGSLTISDQSQMQGTSWMTRVIQKILSGLDDVQPLHPIQMVSQTMPSQAKDGRSRPTFEDVLESLQIGMMPSPFITITHAVPQVRVMEELPKTPPSTPNARHELNDYFGNHQTIFTHAAVVPIYHNHHPLDTMTTNRLPHHIAAPCTVQVSILERYIPPTMPSEVTDFFSLSSRSYLADRLSELSANNGSLILVYPTKTGGQTFTRKYLNPILDPLLRQFVLLNNLTFGAAAAMGVMTAVEKMLDYEEMKRTIESMCQTLAQRPMLMRGTTCSYQITYCESTEVTIDRSTWINWFVEQEQPRLRQNLVEYHQAGGRLPTAIGHKETTTGMLTRDLVDGIKKHSDSAAGHAIIEVGVFVITRSTIT